MMTTGMKKLQEQLKFLRTVPLLDKMDDDQLLRLSNAFELVRQKLCDLGY